MIHPLQSQDMYSGETRDVLITVKFPAAGDDQTAATELLSGRLQYTVPGRGEASRSPLVTLSVARGEAAEATGPNMDVDIQRNRWEQEKRKERAETQEKLLNFSTMFSLDDVKWSASHLRKAPNTLLATFCCILRLAHRVCPCIAVLVGLVSCSSQSVLEV